MFDQDSVAPERTQGYNEMQTQDGLTPLQQSNNEPAPEPEKGLKTDGLAPWDADKFGWVQGANSRYLQPHKHFVADVVHRAENLIALATREQIEGKEFAHSDGRETLEYDNVQELIKDLTSLRETLRAVDGENGTEERAVLRMIEQRVLLANKIAGSTQVDRECRMQRHLLKGGQQEELQENEYFMKSGETRDKWARIGAIWTAVALGVMPEEKIDVAVGVEKLLKQEAIDKTRDLRKPSQPTQPGQSIDPAILAAACA